MAHPGRHFARRRARDAEHGADCLLRDARAGDNPSFDQQVAQAHDRFVMQHIAVEIERLMIASLLDCMQNS
jgi:hypothetical protein